MKPISDGFEFQCTKCPHNLRLARRYYYCFVNRGGKKYKAAWNFGEPVPDFELYAYTKEGFYDSVVKITNDVDSITPYNIEKKIPTLLMFN